MYNTQRNNFLNFFLFLVAGSRSFPQFQWYGGTKLFLERNLSLPLVIETNTDL